MSEPVTDKDSRVLPERMLEKIRATLDEGTDKVTYVQQHELRQYRSEALKEKQPKSIILWTIVVALMGFSLFIFWATQLPDKVMPKVQFYSVENLISFEREVWQEDPALLDELDFYSWLLVRDEVETTAPESESGTGGEGK